MADPETTPKLPPDEEGPIFDQARERLPWPQDDLLPVDDELNVLPGNDPLDEDPVDNGDQEGADPEDMPEDVGQHLDPNMKQTDVLP